MIFLKGPLNHVVKPINVNEIKIQVEKNLKIMYNTNDQQYLVYRF